MTGLIQELRGRPLGGNLARPRRGHRRKRPFGEASPEAGRVAYGDIAILTRNNVQVERMTRWLLEGGIRVSSERTSDITRNRIVQEVVAF